MSRYTLIILALCVSALSGCVSMTPALGGKTILDREYRWTTETDETVYNVHAKLPAGVDVATVDKVSMSGDPDGAWKLNVGADANADTTAQAEALVEVNRQQTETILGMAQTLTKLVDVLGPLAAPYLAPRSSTNSEPISNTPNGANLGLTGLLGIIQKNPQLLNNIDIGALLEKLPPPPK